MCTLAAALPALLAALCGAGAFTPPVTNFAVFSNAEAKMLIRSWNPRPVPVVKTDGRQGMLPSSAENLRRFVRARILLEQESACGAIATFGGEDDSLCLILTRFDGGAHEMILPLWRSSSMPVPIFQGLRVRASRARAAANPPPPAPAIGSRDVRPPCPPPPSSVPAVTALPIIVTE